MISISDIREAADRINPYIVKTPLVRLANLDPFLGCQVYGKLENLQVTGAFKLRGAVNKILSLPKEQLEKGVVCASSGNHGKAVAYSAKRLGIPATVVIPLTAPAIKVEAIRALGAEVVQCEVSERFRVAAEIRDQKGAALIPPYDDELIMAGQGTAGLEIAEQQPDLDAVIVPVSGGGLIGGVSTAIKAAAPDMKVWGAEPAVLPRYTESLKKGERVQVPATKTIADALVSNMPGERCFPVVQKNVDQVFDIPEDAVLKGMKLLLTEGKILAEPSSCIGIAGVLTGIIPVTPEQKICFLISGGSVGLNQIAQLENVELPKLS